MKVRRRHRRRLGHGATVLLLPVMLVLTTAGVGRAAIVPPANPSSDLPPSAALEAACPFDTQIDSACISAGISEIDRDRAAEGIGPITLPTNFGALNPPEQMYVIANLERVDRGLPPVEGLSSVLNLYAMQGAATGTDPSFPPYTNGGGSLWSGGPNIFDAFQSWMYNDGWDGAGSNNEACTSPWAPLCWGHRDIILGSPSSPVLMGAAVSTSGSFGGSVAALFVGGDTVDSPYFTWGQVTQNLPVGLSQTALSGFSHQGQTSTSDVEAWASGEPMDITASISGGDGAISVTPTSCNLAPGQTCNLAVTFQPTNVSTLDATLTITGPNGPQFVSLGGNPGYWQTASDGGVFTFGAATFHGSAGSVALVKPIVGMAALPGGGGYWQVASDGGVFSYGSASFYGSAGNIPLRKPIVGMAAAPDGKGYWLVASDGGIFSFGSAQFYGSAGSFALRAPIVGMAAAPDGKGYWLVASDGGVFAFGSAGFHGSAGALPLVKPVVGMAASPDGQGYWLVASDGGVFSYGSAAFHGSAGSVPLRQPIVGMAATDDGQGYWLVASDGGVFSYGTAQFYGSAASYGLRQPIVGIAIS